MDKTIYYRGQAANFSGNINNGSDIIPSILRDKTVEFSIIDEANYYKKTAIQMKDVLDTDFGSDEVFNTKTLGLLQHQGFLTRLIDITKSQEIARYFASNGHFKEDGYIYHIIPRNNIKEIKDELRLSITRKIYTIINSKKLIEEKINLVEHFKDLEAVGSINLSTIRDAVILDYDRLYSSRDLKNLRLTKQKGSFILLGNEVSKDNILTGNINRSVFEDLSYPVIIYKTDKLNNLFDLSMRGINYVNLFPDADISKHLVSKYNEISELNKKNDFVKLINSSFKIKNKENNKFSYFKNYLLKNIDVLGLDFIQDENKFFFVFKELADYFKYYYDLYLDEYILFNYEDVIENALQSILRIKEIA